MPALLARIIHPTLGTSTPGQYGGTVPAMGVHSPQVTAHNRKVSSPKTHQIYSGNSHRDPIIDDIFHAGITSPCCMKKSGATFSWDSCCAKPAVLLARDIPSDGFLWLSPIRTARSLAGLRTETMPRCGRDVLMSLTVVCLLVSLAFAADMTGAGAPFPSLL